MEDYAHHMYYSPWIFIPSYGPEAMRVANYLAIKLYIILSTYSVTILTHSFPALYQYILSTFASYKNEIVSIDRGFRSDNFVTKTVQ